MKKIAILFAMGLVLQACSKPTHELKSPCVGSLEAPARTAAV